MYGRIMACSRAETEWEQLHRGEDFEDDYYFIGQLFEENWLPRYTV